MIFKLAVLLMGLMLLAGMLNWHCFSPHRPVGHGKRVRVGHAGFPQAKPDWVRAVVLEWHLKLGLSHRKLADLFNRRYLAETGISVGRTWVREVIMRYEHERLDVQKRFKHRVPLPMKNNVVWGVDTTVVTDLDGVQQIVLGAIDHGSRLNVLLLPLKRFNRWTFLGYLFLAIGRHGKPKMIKTDNAQVFRSKVVKRVLLWAGIKLRHSQPGKPWQNGRIERFFGTLKAALGSYPISDWQHLMQSMASFRVWYNVARPHQHLAGRTPQDAWDGIDSFRVPVRHAREMQAWGGRLRGLILRR